MESPTASAIPAAGGREAFPATRWSIVRAARDSDEGAAQRALGDLCGAYWYPLYAYVRRSGCGVEESQDLTQEFFARLLEKGWLGGVDQSRGKFRSWLLTVMKHFLVNEWRKGQRQRRGGGMAMISLDAEERFAAEPVDHTTPETIYAKRWAEAVLARVHERLRAECEAEGNSGRFDVLKAYLLHDGEAPSYKEAAESLSLSDTALKSAIFRLRKRYGEVFRDEIAQTVDDPREVETEIRELLAALSN